MQRELSLHGDPYLSLQSKRCKDVMNSSAGEVSSQRIQSVKDALASRGFLVEIIEFDESTRTAVEAAKVIGCDVAQIIKSLIFCIKETNEPLLILASGTNRVDEKAIEKKVGAKIKKADAEFVRKKTGFAIGGVPPVGHRQKIKTLIDEDLLQFSELWAAAGTPNSVFRLVPKDIISCTDGVVASIKINDPGK